MNWRAVIVKSSSGPRYVVGCRSKVEKSKLTPNTRVALDVTTLTIMRILPREVRAQRAQHARACTAGRRRTGGGAQRAAIAGCWVLAPAWGAAWALLGVHAPPLRCASRKGAHWEGALRACLRGSARSRTRSGTEAAFLCMGCGGRAALTG